MADTAPADQMPVYEDNAPGADSPAVRLDAISSETRSRWSSRPAFIFAAVGSAVGLGNVWRFPYLAFSGGGGAFFLPYLLALVLVGIPLLLLELAMGQVYQTGDINVFGSINKRLRGIGIASIWTGFMIVCYYVVIIAWALVFLLNSGDEPWVGNEDGPVTAASLGNQGFVKDCLIDDDQLVRDSTAASQFFLIDVAGLETGRGLECLDYGQNYTRRVTLTGGLNCEGENYYNSQGTFIREDGDWNRPCYEHEEAEGGVCVSDAECEGSRRCDSSMKPVDVEVDSDKLTDPSLGTCQGLPRNNVNGTAGTCNPCGVMSEEAACWADSDCYWDDECKTYDWLSVSPMRPAGREKCLDKAFVPEWGLDYKCPAVKALGLCNDAQAQAACPITCNSCDFIKQQLECDQGANGFVGTTYAALAFTWFAIVLCLVFGVTTTGRLTYFTMTVPLILLVVIFFAGVTLDGADEGARQYIGRWEMSDLVNRPTMWSQAVGQVFFSLSVGFGVMTAYSSYNTRNQNTVADTLWISLADFLTSFFAGFTVFCVVGNFAYRQGVPFDQVGSVGGLSLAFQTYPVALSKLSGGAGWCALFFLTLFLLGLDSAFSLAEAVVTVVKDSKKWNHVSRPLIVVGTAIVGLLMGLIYSLDNGLYILDAVDNYMNSIALVFVGLMECIACGWFAGYEKQCSKVGQTAQTVFNLTFLFATVGGVQLAFWIGSYDGCFGGVGLAFWSLVFGITAAYLLAKDTPEGKMWTLAMSNIEDLRAKLNSVISPPGSTNYAIPMVWGFLIKFIIPPALSIMLGITFQDNFGSYGSYSLKYQIPGLVFSFLTFAFVLAGMVYPSIYDNFAPVKGTYAEVEEEEMLSKKQIEGTTGPGVAA